MRTSCRGMRRSAEWHDKGKCYRALSDTICNEQVSYAEHGHIISLTK